jgi:MoaA/NifB/PqqE/SkfB family radical SAM enzyme
MWTLQDAPDALATADKVALIDDFAAMSPSGTVVLTGGETMMRSEEFFALIARARERGLTSATNTNGSFIEAIGLDRVLREGPDHLVFSLDSHSPDVHDRNRGVPGSFQATTGLIAALLGARAAMPEPGPVLISTNSVLTDDNILGLLDFAGFVSDLGVDGAIFQVLSPTFHLKGRRDVFYERHFFKDRDAAIQVLEDFRSQAGRFPVIKTTDTDLIWMQNYIAHPEGLTEAVCNSHERNIMVDHRGDVQLCFDMRAIFEGQAVGNIRIRSLEAIWSGQRADAARQVMRSCRRTCGMLNCHRRPN